MAELQRTTVDVPVESTAEAQTAAVDCSTASQSNSNGSSKRKIKVFLAHSSKDEKWVENTKTRLEAEHDIKCIIHQRDFIPGKPVVQNILMCIRNADKTVLVLTNDFLNSKWCTYEAQQILREHLVRERSVILPVLLKDCTVPDFISHLTWLDARQQSFWKKFIQFLESDPVEIAPRGSFFGHESAMFNGKVISTIRLKGWCNFNSIDYTEVYESLRANGIRINEDVVDKIKTAFRESGLARCLCCTQTTSSPICLFFFMMSFGVLFASALILLIISLSDPIYITDVLFSVILVITFFLYTIICVGWFYQMKAIQLAAEKAINSIMMDSNVLFAMIKMRRWTGSEDMCFVYYETKECQEKVEEYLRKIYAKSNARTPTAHTDVMINVESGRTHDGEMTQLIACQDNDQIKIEAKRMLSSTAVEFVRKCNGIQSPSKRGQRHTLHGLCLCQMIENEYRHKYNL